jgi:hypothetical protein
VIVDELRSEERDGLVERSARVRWSGGQGRLRFEVPPELSGPAEDGSPFLATCLLHAMRRHEDLVVDAPVAAPAAGGPAHSGHLRRVGA